MLHLQDGPLELESGLAVRLAAAAADQADPDADLPTLDDDDVAIYKKRIVDVLQPGENVLQALRRLGEMQIQAIGLLFSAPAYLTYSFIF